MEVLHARGSTLVRWEAGLRFLPFENMLIRTDLSVEELRRRLSEQVGEPRGLKILAGRPQPYLGRFEKDRFCVWRDFSYRNSFKPIIRGKLMDVGSGSYVHLVIRPRIAVLIFMLVWFGGVAWAEVSIMVEAVSHGTGLVELIANSGPFLLIPLAFALFGYLLMMGGFKWEARKTVKFFSDLFEPYRVDHFGIPSPKDPA